MPPRRELSIEELLDRFDELRQAKEDEVPGTYEQLGRVGELLIRRIGRDRDSEYKESLDYIIHQHVSNLIYYGTYLKVQNEKNDHTAQSTLEKVLQYDRQNPIAHYRLGFLAYNREKFSTAITYFERALLFQKSYSDAKYVLNDKQLSLAHLYLQNAALLIVERTQSMMKDLPFTSSGLEKYPLVNLNEMIDFNQQQIIQGEYVIHSLEGKQYVSKDKAMEIKMDTPPDTLVVISERQACLSFHGREVELRSIDQLEMLRYLLLYSSKECPKNINDFHDLFLSSGQNEDTRASTFRRKIKRLRDKLAEVPGLPNLIETAYQSYYFNHDISFLIIHPSIDCFQLGGE